MGTRNGSIDRGNPPNLQGAFEVPPFLAVPFFIVNINYYPCNPVFVARRFLWKFIN